MHEAIGRSTGSLTTKIHTAVDALGNPVRFILSSGHGSDDTQALPLLEGFTTQAVIADKGYASDEIVHWIASRGAPVVIPPRSSRTIPRNGDDARYAERHRIECYFNRLKHSRGIATRYCNRARNFASFISLAASVQWLL